MTLTEARAVLGVSKTKMARLVREGRLTVYENPLDRRQKLVERQEVEALLGQTGGRSPSGLVGRSRGEEPPISVQGVASLVSGVDIEAEIMKLRKRAAKQAQKRLKRLARMMEE